MRESEKVRPFEPLFRNPHVLTILGNYWPREYDFSPHPETRRHIRTEPDTEVLVRTQYPVREPLGEVVLLHGLEGDGSAGYIRSMAWHALQAGFVAHRFHMRTCGGTESLCKTLYHAGLTSDLRAFLGQLKHEGRGIPVFATGFSLGGNVALKLAGELGENDLLHGVVAISTPLDLGACARRLSDRENAIYERRFVRRMQQRLIATGRYTEAQLAGCRTVYAMDDVITAPSFGFGNAENYYATQSSKEFLDGIRIPALVIQAKDDIFIPFEIFDRPVFRTNPYLRLLAVEHGGHLGFLARSGQRFWECDVTMEFLLDLVGAPAETLTSR
jgi:hypothetical protein